MNKPFGKLYLIPAPLGEDALQVLPAYLIEVLHRLDYFVVEKAKTARHFIKATQPTKPFDQLVFFELNKRTEPQELAGFLEPALAGHDMGVLSEAGCPGVADPGARIVRLAHEKNILVEPLVGPSSILLALMASGMNGQNFCFNGYLSPNKPDLAKDLRRLEQTSARFGQTQLFIETPYRNNGVIETARNTLHANTRFCMAVDLTLPTESIFSQPISIWQKTKLPEVHKRPAIFLLYAGK